MRRNLRPCATVLRDRFSYGGNGVGVVEEHIVATYEAPFAERGALRPPRIGARGALTDGPAGRRPHEDGNRRCVVDVAEDGLRLTVRVAYSADGLAPQLSTLLAVVAPDGVSDGDLRLVGLDLPVRWRQALGGPQYGVGGIRRRLAVHDRPLLLSTLANENGQGGANWKTALAEQWTAGADIVQDRESFCADDQGAAAWRAETARELADRLAADVGRRPLYVVNLTAAGPALVDQAGRLSERGAEAFLIAPYRVGLDVLGEVARLPSRPLIFAQPALSPTDVGSSRGALADRVLLGFLIRAAGADVGMYPSSPGGNAGIGDEAVAVARALTDPGPWRATAPAPSTGVHPGIIPQWVREFGPDVVINADGAVHGHPSGARAGTLAFRQALDRFLGRGGPVPDELARALARWGGAA